MHEGGVRVATCMKWPGVITPGSETATPITSVDFLTAFAEIVGVPTPKTQPVDGQSFLPSLKGKAMGERAIFWHYPLYLQERASPASAICRGDQKLIEYFEDRRTELYNIPNDTGEGNDLAAKESAKAKELHAELISWRKATGKVEPRELNPYYAGED